MASCQHCGRPIADIRGAHRITRGKYAHQECHDDTLFDVKPSVAPEALARLGGAKIWTENKAKLIERYLYYFVLVTKHGTYVDGFAGPQDVKHPENRSAKLVIESRPRWIKHFHLFDKSRAQVAQLQRMTAAQPPRDREKHEPRRVIRIYEGDFNTRVREFLVPGALPNDATFCLLDQRTFECEWVTIQALASYKTGRAHKIELVYFLPNFWLSRAMKAQRDKTVIDRWWGRRDWRILRDLPGLERAALVSKRLKEEFAYASVRYYPIFQHAEGGGHTMYYLIHAADHPESRRLMARAYRRAVFAPEPVEDVQLELGLADLDPPPDGERD
jgi:three-Cys-motif partner protein